jgi:hypothetical protein
LISFCGLPVRRASGKSSQNLNRRAFSLQEAADVARARAIEIHRAARSIEVLRLRPVALALEESHRDQRVEEVRDTARVQAELGAELHTSHSALTELRKHTEFDGGQ